MWQGAYDGLRHPSTRVSPLIRMAAKLGKVYLACFLHLQTHQPTQPCAFPGLRKDLKSACPQSTSVKAGFFPPIVRRRLCGLGPPATGHQQRRITARQQRPEVSTPAPPGVNQIFAQELGLGRLCPSPPPPSVCVCVSMCPGTSVFVSRFTCASLPLTINRGLRNEFTWNL